MSGPEKKFENKVKAWLESTFTNNVWFFKVFGSMFQKSGVPDIVGCLNGRFFALELKSNVGKASALQLKVIHLMKLAGAYAVVVSPDNWDEVKRDLIKIYESEGIC